MVIAIQRPVLVKARVANFAALTVVTKFCRARHAESSWAEVPFNPVLFRKNLMLMVRTPGTDVLVVETEQGAVTGVLLASLEQLVFNKMVYATDIHFMCTGGGIPLLAEFRRWAIEHHASKIIMGIANDDPSGRVHKFYEAMGMKPVGDAWVMDLADQQETVA